jgi:hypothetical protein
MDRSFSWSPLFILVLFVAVACTATMPTHRPERWRDELAQASLATSTPIATTDYGSLLGTLEPPPAEWISTPLPAVLTTATPASIFLGTDLDNDGDDDWVLNFPAMYRLHSMGIIEQIPLRCIGVKSCPWMIFIFEQEAGQYQPVYKFDSEEIIHSLDDPYVVLVEDLTYDDNKEVVILNVICGSTCSLLNFILSIGMDKEWYLAGAMYGVPTFLDRDGDNVKEVIASNHGTCRYKYAATRSRNEVYQWQNGRYVLVETIFDYDPFAYFVIDDAYTALQKNDLNRALELATQVIENPHQGAKFDCLWLEPIDEARIVSYAGIEAMLVYAQQGDLAKMASILHEITARYTVAENPYLEAAERLFESYQETGDLLLACLQMDTFLKGRGRETEMLFAHNLFADRSFCPFGEDAPA